MNMSQTREEKSITLTSDHAIKKPLVAILWHEILHDGKLSGLIGRSKTRYYAEADVWQLQSTTLNELQIPEVVLKYPNSTCTQQRTQRSISIGPNSNGKTLIS